MNVNPYVNMIQISTKISIILLILSNNDKKNKTTNKTNEMCIQLNTGQFSVVVTCLFNSGCFNCMIIVIN
jgi:hypothetical protein